MQDWRRNLLFFIIVAMMVTLFISRVALSISIIAFVVLSFLHPRIKEQIKNFFSSPLLWSMSLLFFLPLLSGLWTENKSDWLSVVRVKLPLLLLPLAFASPFNFSRKQWHTLAFALIVLVTAGTIWSMFHYVTNMQVVHEQYLQAKTLLTPLGNDHVRFSWLVVIVILLAGWLWNRYSWQRYASAVLALTIAWLIVFLHILAARTGLVIFYLVLIATVIAFIIKKAKTLYTAGLLVALVALPIIAWFLLPTFQNKFRYFQYEFDYFKEAHYLPGGNDPSRIISLKAGWNIMKDNPVKGVGFGDISTATTEWYNKHYPQVSSTDKILPSCEWLIYGSGCGIPGLLIFTFIMLVPFSIRVRNKYRWWLLNAIVAFGFLFDIGLEVQFGIFIYSFIVLLSWKWFSIVLDKN